MESRVPEIQCWPRHIPRTIIAFFTLRVDKMRKYHHRVSALEEVAARLQPQNAKVTAECILKARELAPLPALGSGALHQALTHV